MRPPPANASIVWAVMAVDAAERAATCATAVPSRIRSSLAARNDSGEKASLP